MLVVLRQTENSKKHAKKKQLMLNIKTCKENGNCGRARNAIKLDVIKSGIYCKG